MKVATRRSVNAALRREQIPLEFVTTREGYQYFVFDDGVRYETHSEPVCYVHHLTIAQWVERARAALAILTGDR